MTDLCHIRSLNKYFLHEGVYEHLQAIDEIFKNRHLRNEISSGEEILKYSENLGPLSDGELNTRLAVAQSKYVLTNKKIAAHFKCKGSFLVPVHFEVKY